MTPLLCEEAIGAMDSGDESDNDFISMEMLENICDSGEGDAYLTLLSQHVQ